MFKRRHWIPPLALIFAQLAHGLSWALVFWAAWSGSLFDPSRQFAWIHIVALGWVTMAALAILLHALPAFTGTRWRAETIGRWSLAAYGAGVALMIYAFLADPQLLAAAGSLVLAALLAYLTTAFATAASAFRGERIPRAVARAFAGTFLFLLATALIGFGLAWMASGRAVPAFVASLPAAHGNLGMLGWASLLIFGVSARTFRPIAGEGSRFRFMHVAVGMLALLGVPLLAAGLASGERTAQWAGGSMFAVAAIGYALDAFDIVGRATNTHRPPLAFVVCALLWMLAALAVGAFVLAGKPWAAAYGFLILAGWIGQMINAHFYHIGVRLVATIYRGDADETAPEALLESRLSWFSWAAFQIAIGLVAYALASGEPGIAARGAVFGCCAWIAMAANIAAARIRAAA